MGVMIFALAALAGLFILGLLGVWRRQGREALRQEWKPYAGYGLALTIALWLGLFVFSIAKLVYDDHRTLIAENMALTAETVELRGSIRKLESEVRELQNANARPAQVGPGKRAVAAFQAQPRPRISIGKFQVNIRQDRHATITGMLAALGGRVAKNVRRIEFFDFTDRPTAPQLKLGVEEKIFGDLRQQVDQAATSEDDISPADGPRWFTIIGPVLHESDIHPSSTGTSGIGSIRRNDQGLIVAGLVRYVDDGKVYYTEYCSYVIAPTLLARCVGHNRTYQRDDPSEDRSRPSTTERKGGRD